MQPDTTATTPRSRGSSPSTVTSASDGEVMEMLWAACSASDDTSLSRSSPATTASRAGGSPRRGSTWAARNSSTTFLTVSAASFAIGSGMQP